MNWEIEIYTECRHVEVRDISFNSHSLKFMRPLLRRGDGAYAKEGRMFFIIFSQL